VRGKLLLYFKDRGARPVTHSIHLEVEASTDPAGLFSLAELWSELYLSLSNAVLERWIFEFSTPVNPPPSLKGTTSIHKRGILLSLAINNGLATLEIPAIKPLLFDTTGRFAGIRIREQIVTVNAASAAYHAGGRRLFDEGLNEFIPSSFIVGGKTS